MDFIVKNYEKAVLGAALVILSLSIVFQIIAVSEEIGKTPSTIPKGKELSKVDYSASLADKSINLPAAKKFMDSSSYYFCQKSDCNSLHKGSFAGDCPWCGTKQITVSSTDDDEKVNMSQDSDNAGIPDVDELKLGLNPNDPKDEYADLDGDGFSNIEEFKADTALDDKEEYPLLSDKLFFVEVSEEQLDFRVDLVTKSGTDRTSWDLQVTTFEGRKKETGFFYVGDDLPGGYRIVDISITGKSVKVSNNKSTFNVDVGKRATPPNSERVILEFALGEDSKKLSLKKGEVFTLSGNDGEKFDYTIKTYSKSDQSATIIDDAGDDVTVRIKTQTSEDESEGEESDDGRVRF